MDSFYRIFCIFADARAIDWLLLIVDFLVLVAILWLELPKWRHKCKARKFASRLSPRIDKGWSLQRSVPHTDPHVAGDESKAWVDQTVAWEKETESFIATLSQRAALAFVFKINISASHGVAIAPDGRRFLLGSDFGDRYQIWQVKLENLKKIIENPETYLE